jgi:hypothetical protein
MLSPRIMASVSTTAWSIFQIGEEKRPSGPSL